MRRILDGLYRGSLMTSAGFIMAICAVVIGQVLLNLIDRVASVFFGAAIGLTIPSYADFTGFFLAAASFLALAGTLRDGGHIRVTLLIGVLPDKVRYALELWCVGLGLSISAYACWYMFALTYESWKYSDLSSGIIAVPLWIPQLSLALGLLVLMIAFLDELVCQLRGKNPTWHGKGENLLDGKEG